MTGGRDDAVAIYEAAVAAADAGAAVRRRLGGEARRPYALIAAGKAAVPMARAAVEAFGPPGRGGLVVAPRGAAAPIEACDVREADHPVPSADSLVAGAAALDLAARLAPDSLLVVLVSGGASALLESPVRGVTLDEIVRRTRRLLDSGAPIAEVNAARRSLSRLKGGGLASATRARVLCLVASDVVGDDPAVVGSGPAVPPPGDPAWSRTRVEVVLRQDAAAAGARFEAERRGYRAVALRGPVVGEAREAAADLVALADEARAPGAAVRPPAAFIGGGETTVALEAAAVRPPAARRPGPPPTAGAGASARPGLGGRCQEFALAAALLLERLADPDGIVVLAAGTDGRDGPTDAAGAVVDGETSASIRAAGIDPAAALDRHDSHPALAAAGALLPARHTGTNAADLYVALVG